MSRKINSLREVLRTVKPWKLFEDKVLKVGKSRGLKKGRMIASEGVDVFVIWYRSIPYHKNIHPLTSDQNEWFRYCIKHC